MAACVFSTRTDSDGYLHFSTVFPISSQLFHTSFMHSSWRTPMRNSWINLGQNHDQRVSKFKRSGQRIWHAEKSSNQESTNKQLAKELRKQPSFKRSETQWRTLQTSKPRCVVRNWWKTHAHTWRVSMRTTGHRNSRTHAHNWAQKFKNACAHWHSTDLRGHDDPWTRRTRTALTGTEREASAHWLRESISAAALRTKVHG